MSDIAASQRSLFSLVTVPALITLAVTIVRLVGELERWSPKWFLSGGDLSWLTDVTWLTIPFSAYFGFKLASGGHGPKSIKKAYLCAGAGAAILFASVSVSRIAPLPSVGFRTGLFLDACVLTAVAFIQLAAWPGLVKVLLAYALATRIPIVIIMCFGLHGHWGTDFDYAGTAEFDLPVPGYFWRAFFPQLTSWVGLTVLLGSIAGLVTTDITGSWARKSDRSSRDVSNISRLV